jgi:hypothetical protein
MQVLLVYRPEAADGQDTHNDQPWDGVEVYGLYEPDAELLGLIDKLQVEHPKWQFYVAQGDVGGPAATVQDFTRPTAMPWGPAHYRQQPANDRGFGDDDSGDRG